MYVIVYQTLRFAPVVVSDPQPTTKLSTVVAEKPGTFEMYRVLQAGFNCGARHPRLKFQPCGRRRRVRKIAFLPRFPLLDFDAISRDRNLPFVPRKIEASTAPAIHPFQFAVGNDMPTIRQGRCGV